MLPLVYEELRRLAAWRLANERPGQTLQATALVHEAYLRLVGKDDPLWNGRRHFFAAAAEAMRRILVEKARRKMRLKRGGGIEDINVEDLEISSPIPDDDLLAVDEALNRLAEVNGRAAAAVTTLVPVLVPVMGLCRGKPLMQKHFGLEARAGIERLWGRTTTRY